MAILNASQMATQTTFPRRGTRADGGQTHARILEAAGGLFAAQGFGDVTSKQIAAAAEVDLASINYHFGSRQGLYQAALAEAHRRLIKLDQLQAIHSAKKPARKKLAMFIDMMVGAAFGDQGWSAQLLSREMLSPTSNSRQLLDEEIKPKLGLVQAILGEITGIAPGTPAAARCMISVGAPCLMLIVAGTRAPDPVRSLLSGSSAELAKHLYDFALAGLKAVAAPK